MADYVRQMPHQGSADLARPPSTASRLHIDVPLLVLLVALTTQPGEGQPRACEVGCTLRNH